MKNKANLNIYDITDASRYSILCAQKEYLANRDMFEDFHDFLNYIKADFEADNFISGREIQEINSIDIKESSCAFDSIMRELSFEEEHRDYRQLNRNLNICGLMIIDEPFVSISKEGKKLVRYDFSGMVPKIEDDDEFKLSPKYMSELARYKNGTVYDAKEYDLVQSEVWQAFRQFESFRGIEDKLIKHLKSERLNPKIIKSMKFYDFIHLIQKSANGTGVRNIRYADGVKRAFVKDFIKKCEQPFVAVMNNIKYNGQNISPFYIKALVSSMKEHGITDIDGIKDDKGNIVTGPSLVVHHKNPIVFHNNQIALGEAALFSGMCLTFEKPYHAKLLHGLDCIYSENGYPKRRGLAFINENTVFYGGPSPLHQIYYNYKNDANENLKYKEIKKYPSPRWVYSDKDTDVFLDEEIVRKNKNKVGTHTMDNVAFVRQRMVRGAKR